MKVTKIEELEKLPVDELLDLVGIRAKELQELPDGPVSQGFGVTDDLKTLGKNIVNRINRELHQLFCGNEVDDVAEREKLTKVLRLDQPAMQGALTVFLISILGMDATIAAIAAIIIVKRVIIPAGGEVCSFWQSHLTI